MKIFSIVLVVLSLSAAASLTAQDFGFGFDDETGAASSGGAIPAAYGAAAGAVSIGGEVKASLLGYVDGLSEGPSYTRLGDMVSGKLNFSAGNSFAEGTIKLKLAPGVSSPLVVDEAYLRAFFGGLEIEGGLRKLTWGKADSFGPLDVINPLDYSELTDLQDIMNLKIPRPLVRAVYRFGQFTKLEALFVPSFQPHRFAPDGRWAPSAMAALPAAPSLPDTGALDYAQAGLRFTTTLGSSDLGLQYYYGRLANPAVKITMPPLPPLVELAYNPYHQVGADYAQVLLGFNIRAEFAVNITEDLSGDDAAVYNPHLAWSFGFDRDLVWGINLNVQANETLRLLDGKITGPLDTEAGRDLTSTRITAVLSKKLLRDELELRAAAVWGVEDRDFFIAPAVVWTRDALSVEVSGGVFGGGGEGQFGQYRDNGFVKAAVGYGF